MTQDIEVSHDSESETALNLLLNYQRIRVQSVSGVRTVLVVLSAAGMVYDMESLRQKILYSYPDAAVFFLTTCGNSMGSRAPKYVDLLIDFTGPRQRQKFFLARSLRKRARVAVGRTTGFWRKRLYDRLFDENIDLSHETNELYTRERFVQRAVLALAGVPIVRSCEVLEDQGKTMALELPALSKV